MDCSKTRLSVDDPGSLETTVALSCRRESLLNQTLYRDPMITCDIMVSNRECSGAHATELAPGRWMGGLNLGARYTVRRWFQKHVVQETKLQTVWQVW